MEHVIWKNTLHKTAGKIPENIYGGFVEHLGRNVYGGVYDPASPMADEEGFRRDVLKLIRELDMPVTRYPGRSCMGLFHWEDGIGPQSERRAKLDPAWHQLEPNTFGLDEFIRWCRKAGTEPLITINIANRSLTDTASLYEYCNFPGGTYWSDRRRNNGADSPYGIRKWCLGNELYGEWEFGTKTAEEYGKLAREHAKVLRQLDPECFLILCGKPDDMQWNRTVLELCGEFADSLSLHNVFSQGNKNLQEYLHTVDQFDLAVTEAENVCREIMENTPRCRRLSISVDEWILWDFNHRLNEKEKWSCGMHLLEQDYTLKEALITGSLLSLFHRHAETLALACIAQSVNVLAPIRTEKDFCWKQSIFYPFALTSRFGRGHTLQITEFGNEKHSLYGSAVETQEGETVLFITNRSEEKVLLEYESNTPCDPLQTLFLTEKDPDKTNSPSEDFFIPQENKTLRKEKNRIFVQLEALSWNMVRLQNSSATRK